MCGSAHSFSLHLYSTCPHNHSLPPHTSLFFHSYTTIKTNRWLGKLELPPTYHLNVTCPHTITGRRQTCSLREYCCLPCSLVTTRTRGATLERLIPKAFRNQPRFLKVYPPMHTAFIHHLDIRYFGYFNSQSIHGFLNYPSAKIGSGFSYLYTNVPIRTGFENQIAETSSPGCWTPTCTRVSPSPKCTSTRGLLTSPGTWPATL
jgi:hypothetical protein